MEGLIPMVYKSLKKTKTRRQYKCLSSGAAETYNIEDFYSKDDIFHGSFTPPLAKRSSGASHHRRYNSMHVSGGFSAAEDRDAFPAKPKQQLVRFRSHNRMLSCITGG